MLAVVGLFLATTYVLEGSFFAGDGLSVPVLVPSILLSSLTSRLESSTKRSLAAALVAAFAVATAASIAALWFGTVQALSGRALILVLLILVWNIMFALNGIRLRILRIKRQIQSAARERQIEAQKV
jgi:fatty acid desaturase